MIARQTDDTDIVGEVLERGEAAESDDDALSVRPYRFEPYLAMPDGVDSTGATAGLRVWTELAIQTGKHRAIRRYSSFLLWYSNNKVVADRRIYTLLTRWRYIYNIIHN